MIGSHTALICAQGTRVLQGYTPGTLSGVLTHCGQWVWSGPLSLFRLLLIPLPVPKSLFYLSSTCTEGLAGTALFQVVTGYGTDLP